MGRPCCWWATALVVSPERTERTVAAFDWSLEPGEAAIAAPRSAAAQALAANAMADALPLFEALADTDAFPATVTLPLAARLSLRLRLHRN
jgi:hypothetical protein